MLSNCLLEEWKEGEGQGEKEGGREGGRNEGRKGGKVKVWCQEQSAGTTLRPEVRQARGRPQMAQERPAGPGRKGTLSRACCARGRLMPQVREGTSRNTAVLGRQA